MLLCFLTMVEFNRREIEAVYISIVVACEYVREASVSRQAGCA